MAISYYYPPLATPRSIRLAILSSFLARHHLADWHVLCARHTSRIANVDHELTRIIPKEIKILRAISPENRFFNYLARRMRLLAELTIPDTSISWYPFALKKVSPFLRKSQYDLIVSFSSPATSHLVAQKIKQITGLKWIAYLSDPITNFGITKTFKEKEKKVKKIESEIFNQADRLIFTNEYGKKYALEEYNKDIKVKAAVLPHAFDPEYYSHESLPPAHYGNKLTFLYAGIFYGKRQPDVLLQSLCILREKKPDCYKQLLFIFMGQQPPALHKRIRQLGLHAAIDFIQSRGYFSSLELMNQADVLFVYDAEQSVSPFLPSKLVDYIGARKPIFGISPKNGPTYEILINGGHFINCSYEPKQIADLLCDIWNLWRQRNLAKRLPKDSIYNNHHVNKICAEFLKIIEQ